MARLVALGAMLAFVSVCHTAPQSATVVVDHGNVGIGLVSGGTFGPGSFSIGRPGTSRRGQTNVYVNEDGDSEHILIQATNHKGQQDNNRRPQHDNAEPNNSGGTNSGNTQLYPVKHLTTLVNTGQGGMPRQEGSEGGSIVIDAVVLPNHENNKENKVNKQPYASDASAIEATYASNSGNNGFPSAGVAFSSGGSIAIGAIAGGNFGQGILSFNNKRPGANVPQQQNAANNEDIGYQNTENEAPFSIGHGVNSPANGNAEVGYTYGQNKGNKQTIAVDASAIEAIFGSNSGENELSSVGNGFSISGQGSVAIGAITGGNSGEGTLSLNNKRPGANISHKQPTVNNGDIGYQSTGNEAPRCTEHSANSNVNGNAGVSYNHGQSSTGYNAYNNEQPWIWNR